MIFLLLLYLATTPPRTPVNGGAQVRLHMTAGSAAKIQCNTGERRGAPARRRAFNASCPHTISSRARTVAPGAHTGDSLRCVRSRSAPVLRRSTVALAAGAALACVVATTGPAAVVTAATTESSTSSGGGAITTTETKTITRPARTDT